MTHDHRTAAPGLSRTPGSALRLDVPVLEPDDQLVERLAAVAASTRPATSRVSAARAGWRAGLAATSVAAIVGGGAWGAAAVIGQHGGPTQRHHAPASRPGDHPARGGVHSPASTPSPGATTPGTGPSALASAGPGSAPRASQQQPAGGSAAPDSGADGADAPGPDDQHSAHPGRGHADDAAGRDRDHATKRHDDDTEDGRGHHGDDHERGGRAVAPTSPSVGGMNDDDLVRRAKSGDGQAWRELYRAHAGRLVVWLGVRPSEDAAVTAEDLAAEAWLTAARRIHEFTGSSSDFGGWIFGIARNLAANSLRRSRRRSTDPVPEPPEHGHADGPEPALVARDWVAFALRGLPPRERDVIACTEVVGLDVESTARALGMTAVAVRVARHRALKRLRRSHPPEQEARRPDERPAPPRHARTLDSRSR